MNIIQTGYESSEKLKLFVNMFFSENEEGVIYSDFSKDGCNINIYTVIIYDGIPYTDEYFYKCDFYDYKSVKNICECAIIKSFVRAASKIRNIPLPWGAMCGIRPAKMVRELYERGFSNEKAYNYLKDVYNISDEKLKLSFKVAENEKEILKNNKKDAVSLYIGIPFCPTRCLYCSFVSTDIRVSGRYIDDFVNYLLKEIEKTAEILKEMGSTVENIYIGGGTPTTLSASQLEKIYNALNKYIITDRLREFTLEAGRPDTITKEKLYISRDFGVNRISINPQTMNDETLVKIGRAHTTDMIYSAFGDAKDVGFDVINMDLIAGLPGETPEMFYKSIDECIKLNPENITVHCMCVKRAATLKRSGINLTEYDDMIKMLGFADKRMNENGYSPYYMYRQKNMSGNLENVGYAKKNCMSFYNVNIMEEVQTIIALGGGGSSKIVNGDRIERIFNFKDPAEYIKRFDEILKKKDEILLFSKV